MRILFITPGYAIVPSLNGGAVEKLIETLIEENELKKELSIDVISVNDGVIPKLDHIKKTNFYYINNKTLKYKIKRIVRAIVNKIPLLYIGNEYIHNVEKIISSLDNSYDYVIVENNPLYILNIKKYFKCPIILHLHNDRLNIRTKFNKKLYNMYDEIIAISYFIRDQVENIGNLNKTKVLYNGIDVKKFAEFNVDKCKNLKNKYKLQDSFVFLYTGRILKIKGVKELIKAFNELCHKYQNIKLLIIGDMSNKYDGYVRSVNKEYKKNRSNIVLLGYVNNNIISDYYHIADAQIVPSICNEALGNTAIEGISSGIPVLVSNKGGLPEVVNGIDEFIIDTDNFQDNLVEKMEFLINNKDKIKNIEEKCKKRIKIFDKEKYYNNFIEILKNKKR